ncbi:MAG: cell division protein SepF [Clostridia bacterium]
MAFSDTLHRLGKLIGLYADEEEMEYAQDVDEFDPEAYEEEEPEQSRYASSGKQTGYGSGNSYVRAGGAARSAPIRSQPEEPQPLFGGTNGRRNAPPVRDNVVPMPTREEGVRSRHSEIIICVRRKEDSQEIINYVLNGQSVILNFEEIDDAQCQRVIDMLSGAAFALRGTIQRVSHRNYLLAPASVEVVNGDVARMRKTAGNEAYASADAR